MRLVMGLVFLAIGVAIIFWTNKRAFKRRNMAGVQEFSSYGHSLLIRTLERFGRIGAWFFILAGAGSLLTFFVTGRG